MSDAAKMGTEEGTISVYPTMIVGLGGTGCKIAKRLKRTLNAEGESAMNIRFVGIDTDLVENSARSEAELPLDRFITIGGQPVHFDAKDHNNRPMLHWLPTDDTGQLLVGTADLGAGQGAGGHRLVGRFAYNYFAPDQFVNLQQTMDQLLDLGNNPLEHHWAGTPFKYIPGLAIYVVGSLVGGTGSGSFVDALVTLHTLAEKALMDRKRLFTGVFLLPDVFDYCAIGSQSYDHMATAYSCLKDLDLLLTTDDPELRTFWYYNQPEPTLLKERLLDTCYLVDRYSGSGALLRADDVYDFVATHLFAAIGTPLGATARSVENNSHKTGVTDEAGGRCSYSSFGLVGMDYSQELLRRYCADRLAVDAIDLSLGADLPETQIETDATGYLAQLGLSGGRESRAASFLAGRVGDTFVKRPESMEDEPVTELYDGLSQGFQEFTRALENGNLRAELQKNYRDHLLSSPDSGRKVELMPGEVAPAEPQMWRYRISAHIDETVRRVGLKAGKQLSMAFLAALERSFQDLESGLTDVRNNVQTAQATFNDSLAAVRAISPMVQLFHKQAAREAKRRAALARNALVKARVHAEAAELARSVYNDDTNGLIPLVSRTISQMDQLLEALATVRQTLDKQASNIVTGSRENASALAAPDRSCLLYDVLPGHAFPQLYAALSDRRRQLLDRLLDEKSSLHLLDQVVEEKNKAEALAVIFRDAGADLFPELADRHILDVITDGVSDPQERVDRLKKYLRDVTPKLRPHAPSLTRRGEAQTYDYCVVMYPQHHDEALNQAFQSAAEETVREANVTVQVVATEGANNRIVMTYMQHGIPLNTTAFPRLENWMRAYEHLRPRNQYLDVDRRWRKLPGPGQHPGGAAREKLFTLGVAYGLIAKQGDFFYVNFERGLLSYDKEARSERDQYEVDLSKVQQAIQSSASPLEWFPHITQGPSAVDTIPAHYGSGLGKRDRREARDRIAQGREQAMSCFTEDEGEDYQDVADGIAAVLEGYTSERGRANVREELTWYRDEIAASREKSTGLGDQYQKEINLIDELLATLDQEGRFELPVGKGT